MLLQEKHNHKAINHNKGNLLACISPTKRAPQCFETAVQSESSNSQYFRFHGDSRKWLRVLPCFGVDVALRISYRRELKLVISVSNVTLKIKNRCTDRARADLMSTRWCWWMKSGGPWVTVTVRLKTLTVLSEHVHAEKAAALLYGHAYIRKSEMQSLDYTLCVIIVQLLQLNPSFPASCLSGVGLIAQAHGGNG